MGVAAPAQAEDEDEDISCNDFYEDGTYGSAYCSTDGSDTAQDALDLLDDLCKAARQTIPLGEDWRETNVDTNVWTDMNLARCAIDVEKGLQDGPVEPVQEFTPPPPCWDSAINNCPVGGALRFASPEYAMVGVPVTMYAYASWRPDANAPSQPTNGTAVIRVDGEDYSGVEFKDGVAEWRFIPETEGMKEFTASGVLFSGLSGANAYIDTVPARTYVLEYDPAAYATALKKKAVEVGETYVITDPNQARSYLEDRYAWSVSEKSDDVCAVYETKKGAVKAKFNGEGKCTVIWLDKESEESGKYSFIAKK